MIIDGKAIADIIQAEIKDDITQILGRKPCLAVILVGTHPPSQIYVKRKTQACEAVGMLSIKRHFPAELSEKELLNELDLLNTNPEVDGILVQLPLPAHINPINILRRIAPDKDVDGLNPVNVGKLLIGELDGFVPCTPLGIKTLLERSSVDVQGKHVVVMGRSNLVGKPMAALLVQNAPGANATVTIVHSQTKNLATLTRMADVLIVAMGQPKFVNAAMVKDGVVIIDVGINKIASEAPPGYQIVGDVDFDDVKDKCALITPVPGGVGPMTIAMLLSNTLKSHRLRITSERGPECKTSCMHLKPIITHP
jgi:methylenetetrahydrofolate dehydrogenase (NADP+)/methenyltetrahydrofolate cyclohydrolase